MSGENLVLKHHFFSWWRNSAVCSCTFWKEKVTRGYISPPLFILKKYFLYEINKRHHHSRHHSINFFIPSAGSQNSRHFFLHNSDNEGWSLLALTIFFQDHQMAFLLHVEDVLMNWWKHPPKNSHEQSADKNSIGINSANIFTSSSLFFLGKWKWNQMSRPIVFFKRSLDTLFSLFCFLKLLLLRCSHIFQSQKCKSSLCCSRRRRQASWWEIMKPSNCCGKCQKPSCFHPKAWCRALPPAFHKIWTHCPIQNIHCLKS